MTRPARFWWYRKGTWSGPLLMRSDDEYGRLTVVLRLPGERAVVWAYRYCQAKDGCPCTVLGRCPVTGRVHSVVIGGRLDCEDCGNREPVDIDRIR